MERPFLSIIVPCYNCQEYITNTLNSVLEQICDDFELIFLNDGSTDNSLQVARELLQHSTLNYKIYTHENQGVSKTRNIGIKNATGRYIYFLDADDIVNADLVAKTRLASFQNPDMILFRYEKQGEISKLNSPKTSLSNLSTISAFCRGEINVHMCSFIVKKEVIESNHIYFTEGISYGEDHEFILKLMYHSQTIKVLDEVLFNYIYRLTSAVNTFSLARIDSLDSANRVCEYLMSNEPKNIRLKNDLAIYFLGKINYNLYSLLELKGNNSEGVYKKMTQQIKEYSNLRLCINSENRGHFLNEKIKCFAIKNCLPLYILYFKAQFNSIKLKQFLKRKFIGRKIEYEN